MAGVCFQAAPDILEGPGQRDKQAEQARELSGFAAAQQFSQDQTQVVSGDSQVSPDVASTQGNSQKTGKIAIACVMSHHFCFAFSSLLSRDAMIEVSTMERR